MAEDFTTSRPVRGGPAREIFVSAVQFDEQLKSGSRTVLDRAPIAATIGVISPSGNEVGPFLPIEQACLSQIVSAEQRTQIFSWYNLVGSLATALGALIGGILVKAGQNAGLTSFGSYRLVVTGYALIGVALGFSFTQLSSRIELSQPVFPGSVPKKPPRRRVARAAARDSLSPRPDEAGWCGRACGRILAVRRTRWFVPAAIPSYPRRQEFSCALASVVGHAARRSAGRTMLWAEHAY